MRPGTPKIPHDFSREKSNALKATGNCTCDPQLGGQKTETK